MPCLGNCSQGRTDCPHKVQCEPGRVEQSLTDWGLLAELGYSEPETADLPGINPLTRTERVIAAAIWVTAFCGAASLIVSCVSD